MVEVEIEREYEFGADEVWAHERLEAIDHAARVLEYSIPAVEYIGVEHYAARAQVVELAPGRSRVLWSCTAEAEGVPEAEASEKTRAFYEAMLGWIGDHLERR